MMKKHSALRKIVTILAVLMLICGVALVAFPPVSNTYGKYIANSVSDKVDKRIQMITNDDNSSIEGDIDIDIEKLDIQKLKDDSIKYNKDLISNQRSYLTSEYAFENPALNLSEYGINDGVYGYIKADTIGMRLPIYLGANNSNMSYGAVHLTYTSLPIGGKSSTSVIAGHTGYVGRIFFDDIKQLAIGDVVTVVTYFDTISYNVVDHKTVKPEQTDDFFISDDSDKLILVTCIKNSEGGFDRHLVFCER